MAAVPSNPFPLGADAPRFQLLDTISGKILSLDELKSPLATVIMFICNHCPYVKHIQTKIVDVANRYLEKGISFIAISANDAIAYPDDAPEKMTATAKQFNFSFPYLYDESQEVARAYRAACTPDFYIFDDLLKCVYHGQFDDARPNSPFPITGDGLTRALNNILLGKAVDPIQKPSLGCSIKWRAR